MHLSAVQPAGCTALFAVEAACKPPGCRLPFCTNYPIGAIPQTPFPDGPMAFFLLAFHAGSLRQMGRAATQAGYPLRQSHCDSRLGTRGTCVAPASLPLTEVRQRKPRVARDACSQPLKKSPPCAVLRVVFFSGRPCGPCFFCRLVFRGASWTVLGRRGALAPCRKNCRERPNIGRKNKRISKKIIS